jgi:ribonuclease HII
VSDEWIIGVDEAGRGPVIGPLVVGALAIRASDAEELRELGVKDSKDLSVSERERIEAEISGRVSEGRWRSGLVICQPSRIDINSLTSDLNSLEIELFAEAIKATALSSKDGVVRADACDVNEQRFARRLTSALGEDWADWDVEAKHGMDSSDLVAGGASILAKVTRDAEIHEISIRTGLDIGSGYPSDLKTRGAVERLLTNGKPHDCLRWSWATVSDIWSATHGTPVPVRSAGGGAVVQSSLDDWSS